MTSTEPERTFPPFMDISKPSARQVSAIAVDEAVSNLGLRGLVEKLDSVASKTVIESTAEAFVDDRKKIWWWESIRTDVQSASIQATNGYTRLAEVCPSGVCYLVVTDDLEDTYWTVYSLETKLLKPLIGDCHAFEYFVVSPRFEWVVFENHHDILIGAGQTVPNRIKSLS